VHRLAHDVLGEADFGGVGFVLQQVARNRRVCGNIAVLGERAGAQGVCGE